MNNVFAIWFIISFALVALELVWPGFFFFLSFAIGAIFSAISSFFGFSLEAQMLLFLSMTAVSFLILRKWVKQDMKEAISQTNVYALVGRQGVVIQDIEIARKGLVRINGEVWSAIASQPEAFYAKGTFVEIVDIKGVNVIVTVK